MVPEAGCLRPQSNHILSHFNMHLEIENKKKKL